MRDLFRLRTYKNKGISGNSMHSVLNVQSSFAYLIYEYDRKSLKSLTKKKTMFFHEQIKDPSTIINNFP